jgi:hypothetical protein
MKDCAECTKSITCVHGNTVFGCRVCHSKPRPLVCNHFIPDHVNCHVCWFIRTFGK